MSRKLLFKSASLPQDASGVLLNLTPQEAMWEYIRFTVRRIARDTEWTSNTDADECCLVLLSGDCTVECGTLGRQRLGPRASVFASYPHAAYFPHGERFTVTATETTEVAECRAPSRKSLEPRIVRPEDCGFEIRGGGNATRQIVDILPPSFPADRLLICEVFTPSGNWSSYPPHKHDLDNPPAEVDLEETYYYRMREATGYGFQRLYTADGRYDDTLKVEDGDLVVIRDGYHPFVTAYGSDAYYLNVLAGTCRSMAATDDPRYAALRRSWPAPDPRVPLLHRPNPRDRDGSVQVRAPGSTDS
jgi:5-deoxy-glucuronate isomerase